MVEEEEPGAGDSPLLLEEVRPYGRHYLEVVEGGRARRQVEEVGSRRTQEVGKGSRH